VLSNHNVSIPLQYEIQVSGRIDPERAAWLGCLDLSIHCTPDGKTTSVLSGTLPDQAALFGLINLIRDMGLKLISIHSLEYQKQNETSTFQTQE
jgi:hypothetical protein